MRQRTSGEDTLTGRALALPHACCFVSWLLHCTHRKSPCFLRFAILLRCYALGHYPGRSNGPLLVAVAKANAPQLPLPPKRGWRVSPVNWVLRNAVGHLGTHGNEQCRYHLSVRDARLLQLTA